MLYYKVLYGYFVHKYNQFNEKGDTYRRYFTAEKQLFSAILYILVHYIC